MKIMEGVEYLLVKENKTMYMKVIAIDGGPRKAGSTTTLVSHILKGAEKKGAETEIISLYDLDYSGCRGCLYCKSHNSCKQDDDMNIVYDKIWDADVILFATPVYFAQMTGQLKNCLDRLYALIDAEYVSRLSAGKKFGVVVTQGDESAPFCETIKSTIEFTMEFLGIESCGSINANGVHEAADLLRMTDLLAKAEAFGEKAVS
ncbi:MAG: flavodoxin family protein [Methanomicrobiales archaeon]|jgi:multimeric flavodoxin WrbA|nr:flavodoxin family protein [Methanomicrobiales archaeon]